MKFEEFVQKVEQWAKVRKIYEESTEAHQQAKALEEIGEYLTAETDEERMDAIGDIAVCIVNAAKIGRRICGNPFFPSRDFGSISYVASDVVGKHYSAAFEKLNALAIRHGYNFEDCLKMAWNAIKDRKGMMVNKKYVKWDDLNGEQREEFLKNERNEGWGHEHF